MTFGLLLTVLVGFLIFWGIPAAVASGIESAVSMIYLIIGTAIGGLIGPMQKLCEDAPPAPPAQVPETTVLEIMNSFYHFASLKPEGAQTVVEESHTRPREGIADG